MEEGEVLQPSTTQVPAHQQQEREEFALAEVLHRSTRVEALAHATVVLAEPTVVEVVARRLDGTALAHQVRAAQAA